MSWRRLDLGGKAFPETCGWIFDNEVYREWSTSPHGPLWIKGKPGSGKSTLMEVITRKLYHLVEQEGSLLLAFFFNGFGNEPLVKSTAGMYRSLLHQLIDHDARSLEKFRVIYERRIVTLQQGDDNVKCWYDEEQNQLKEFFAQALEDLAQRGKKVTIIIDALDEAVQGSAQDVITFLHRLDGALRKVQPGTRMCFSCRHYPIYTASNRHEIYMEKHNHVDIVKFVRTEFAERGISRRDVLESTGDLAKLESELVKRACGVFLWVALIVPVVVRQLNVATPLDTIFASLDQAPTRLGEIYSDIIRNVIHQDLRSNSYQLMEWASRHDEPLRLSSIVVSVRFTRAYAMSARDFHRSTEAQDVLEIRVGNFTGGLLEVKLESEHRAAFFIHPTVKTFLIDEGLRLLRRLKDSNSANSSTPDPALGFSYESGPSVVNSLGSTRSDALHVFDDLGEKQSSKRIPDSEDFGQLPVDAHQTRRSEKHVKTAAQFFERLYMVNNALSKNRNRAEPRVKVAIIGTGIDMSHPAIRMNRRRVEQTSTWADGGANEDDWGHGTHAAALISKIAPEAKICVARVAHKHTSTIEPEVVAKAIGWAVESRVDIICMSVSFDTAHPALDEAVKLAIFKDIMVFAPAGSGHRSTRIGYPARRRDVFCVSSADPVGNPSPFNPVPRSEDENFIFLGEDVESAWPLNRGQGPTKSLSGTSIATSVAAGTAALILEASRQLPLDEPDIRHYLNSPQGMRMIFRFLSSGRYEHAYVTPWKLLDTNQSPTDLARVFEALARSEV